MVMVGGGWRFVWVALLVSLVVAVVAVSILTTMHVINKSSTPVGVGFNAPAPVGLPVNVSLNMPIYVVGPQSLTQRLVGVGVPQSLIKPVNLSQLSALPGNSTILIGYSIVKPNIVAGVVNGVVRLNLTSPVIGLLTGLVAKGDLIMLYGNSSDLMAMEYLLAYSWARRYGTFYLNYQLNGHGVPSDYLIAYPIIPISGKEALAVAFGGPHYLVIGPAMPMDVLRVVMMYIILKHPSTSQAQVGVTQDPCWLAYSNYYEGANELEPGIYEGNHNYLIWAAPLSGAPYTEWGIEGYSDGNGTFYYDTCLVINTQVFYDSAFNVFDVPVMVYGYVGYMPSQTMINNGGEVLSETGTIDFYTSYEYYSESSLTNSFIAGPDCTGSGCLQPQPTSSTTSYSISVYAGFAGTEPYAGVEFTYTVTLPSGSESISLNYGPSTQVYKTGVGNVTWTFNLNNANTPNDTYYNGFEVITPPLWFMQNPSSSQQNAYLPIDMSTKVMTSSQLTYIGLCEYYNNTYEYVWVDGGWWLTAQPMGSSMGLVPSSTSWTYSISPSASQYVTGVSSWSTLEPIGCSGR